MRDYKQVTVNAWL